MNVLETLFAESANRLVLGSALFDEPGHRFRRECNGKFMLLPETLGKSLHFLTLQLVRQLLAHLQKTFQFFPRITNQLRSQIRLVTPLPGNSYLKS